MNKVAPKLKDAFGLIPSSQRKWSEQDNAEMSNGNLNNSINRLCNDKNGSFTDNENLSFKSDDALINSELVKRSKKVNKSAMKPIK